MPVLHNHKPGLFLNKMNTNKFHILLYLAVLACTTLAQRDSSFSDHLTGIQAVSTAVSLHNTDNLELSLSDRVAEISNEFRSSPYDFICSEQHDTHNLSKPARAPPLV